jgi:hypothetical protein
MNSTTIVRPCAVLAVVDFDVDTDIYVLVKLIKTTAEWCR